MIVVGHSVGGAFLIHALLSALANVAITSSKMIWVRSRGTSVQSVNKNRMNKRVARESVVSDDNRIVKLESDVQHLQSDVTEIKGDVKSDFSGPDPQRAGATNLHSLPRCLDAAGLTVQSTRAQRSGRRSHARHSEEGVRRRLARTCATRSTSPRQQSSQTGLYIPVHPSASADAAPLLR